MKTGSLFWRSLDLEEALTTLWESFQSKVSDNLYRVVVLMLVLSLILVLASDCNSGRNSSKEEGPDPDFLNDPRWLKITIEGK